MIRTMHHFISVSIVFLFSGACRIADNKAVEQNIEVQKSLALAKSEVCGEYNLITKEDEDNFVMDSPYSFDWMTTDYLDQSKLLVGYERIDSFASARELCTQIAPYLVKESEIVAKLQELNDLESQLGAKFEDAPETYTEEERGQLISEITQRRGWLESTQKLYKSWDSLLLQLGPLGKSHSIRLIKDQKGQTLAAIQLEAEQQACRIEAILMSPALRWPSNFPTPAVDLKCKQVSDPVAAGLHHAARELKDIHGCTSIFFTPNSSDTPTHAFVDAGFKMEQQDSIVQYKADATSLVLNAQDDIKACASLQWGDFAYEPVYFGAGFYNITSITPLSEK